MKSIFTCLLATLLAITGRQALAQVVIDLSTGVSNTAPHPLIPYVNSDDTWIVSAPQACPDPNDPTTWQNTPTTWQSAIVSTGVPATGSCGLVVSAQPQHPDSRWISPGVNLQGESTYILAGCYYYKTTFQYPVQCQSNAACAGSAPPIRSVTFNFNYIMGADNIYGMLVNGHMHYNIVSYLGSNMSFSIPASEINIGQNVIMILVCKGGCAVVNPPPANPPPSFSPGGLEINGNLTIYTYGLTNADGEEKSEFCIGEDVILGGSIYSNGCTVELLNANNTVLGAQSFQNTPYAMNISNIFHTALQNPSAGQVYKVRLTVNTPCSGPSETVKTFKYICCDSGPDAAFSLMTGNNGAMLTGSGIPYGSHEWSVYSAPNINTGPYTLIEPAINNETLLLNVAMPCYYVTHRVTTACGTACMSQRLCSFESCNDKKCNLNAPANMKIDQRGHGMSWDAVAGATSYIIQVILNDPKCCGDYQPGDPMPLTWPQYITEQNPYHTLTPEDLGLESYQQMKCFSWRVYAVCPDGAKSQISALMCSSGTFPGSGEPSGRMASAIAGDITGSEATEDMAVQIFPNPASGLVSISVHTPMDVSFSLSIFDNTGRCIKHIRDIQTIEHSSAIQWHTDGLGKGVYLVKISTSDNQLITKKIVVE